VVPGFEEHLVGGGEGASFRCGQAAASEGVADLYIIFLGIFHGEVFVVDGLVVLGGRAQLEVRSSLVHLLYLSNQDAIISKLGLV